MTSTIDEMGSGLPARGGRDNRDVFLRAKRHSVWVRRLRIGIPVCTASVLGVVALMSWLDPLRILIRLPTDVGGKLVISGSKIMMESPKLAGFTRDSRAYEVVAREAAQDITKPDFVELVDLRAKIESQDKTAITVTAVDGLYNRKSGLLKLSRDVILSTSSYTVTLAEALVDTTTNNVVSDHPVEVKMLQGTVNSNRLEVTGGGEVVRFIGDVKMNLDNLPNPDKAAPRQ